MCLIAFSYRQHPDFPLILIANRDEFYARPSLPLGFWSEHDHILGGRDLEQDGSWLALNRDGKLAAVTNHRDGRNRPTDKRSRGHLIRDYLVGEQSAAEFALALQRQGHHYGGFNLLLGDCDDLYYLSNRGGGYRRLKPGLYGLSNAHLDTPWPKLTALKKRLHNYLATDSEPHCEQLLPLLWHPQQANDNQLPDTGISHEWEKLLSSCFIQSEHYGTRASTALIQHRDGRVWIAEQNFSADGQRERLNFQLAPQAALSVD
ncbi:NRDE family protein [Marinobacterium arenosum]|uniref:NRDE family protein n=1 Tax=Marinobacterium arenosum TaxID=2862496 RepID=UPI001C93A5A1|nr:NRDE family protein [Marinobacterium arenosum]MBY4676890.1 NRDE family protein [Marinobacterium arenosum]